MCGIAGIISKNFRDDILHQMIDTLSYRGPDDKGVEIDNLPNAKIGLAHRRLSIIDLSSAGHQPMSNPDKSVIISFNGEIYNFQEIKNELIKKGYKFQTATDTEVIIHGYKEFGTSLFAKMNGMFGLAIFDKRKQKLILARDRFGQKPVYFYNQKNDFVFSSELKAMLKFPAIKKEVDYHSLAKYLAYEYLPSPNSIIKNVQKLEPGHYLELDCKKFEIRKTKFWDVSFNNRFSEQIRSMSFEELQVQIRNRLKSAIQKRLMSDVPLGVFLSGGIDSSAIVALLSEITDIRKVKTFSIGFEESSFDETNHALKISNIFKTNHHWKKFTAGTMLDILPEIISKLDEPFADASILPTYLLSQFTKEKVTVALGGDGGDELFAGYDPFLAHYFAKYYQYIPRKIHKNIIKPLIHKMPVSDKNMSLDFKAKHFIKGIYNNPEIRNQIWLGAISPQLQKGVFADEISQQLVNANVFENLTDLLAGKKFADWIQKIGFVYQKQYLAEDILFKIDRASMMNSLEARTPFLDHDFADFINAIPSKYKFHNLSRKYIFKKSLEGRLPDSILYRKKKGFGIPLSKWMKDQLKQEIETTFFGDSTTKNFFNLNYLRKIFDEHQKNIKDNRKQIWSIYIFLKWWKSL